MTTHHHPHDRGARAACALTGVDLPLAELIPLFALTPGLAETILREKPGLPRDALLSRAAVAERRDRYIREMLAAEHGELTSLEAQVAASIANADTISSNVAADYAEDRTLGERWSDAVANFGGSWTFITLFAVVLVAWMGLNVAMTARAFDPYPFILLNLVLSCIAAVQAPIIMMSQKRQEAKDRLRSENDYRVNLKAELEIRHLHEKLDHILSHQWQRLAEIQQMQIEIMQERRSATPEPPR
ncbi:DUF1003 domain-containing protein [Pinisolibacter aquiterrae]|uniref:DUF1003 domain-containing protein n=1 Tax=Pinisolibacter aquiterrae TaxID=2815579 RepID=UPI001C3C6331|nr:DUF1003 domain-containing protein [Pinisolibacter aquiterrae]MBV5264359.1 DUF1003 domain-containing protein [Pinisolibacter aquiterrae]MCC8234492.1 DUF1003 domain-containing protein [Pinisolibacter aquiterrae]